jgi:hypothetical protein
MRVLVCGGRDATREQAAFVYGYLSEEFNGVVTEPLTIISGAARGVDSVAAEWATDQMSGNVILVEYPADWEKHGKRAGYLRNVQMLEEGKPDLVIAFPGGRGTQMMINLAKGAGVPVEIVTYEEDR